MRGVCSYHVNSTNDSLLQCTGLWSGLKNFRICMTGLHLPAPPYPHKLFAFALAYCSQRAHRKKYVWTFWLQRFTKESTVLIFCVPRMEFTLQRVVTKSLHFMSVTTSFTFVENLLLFMFKSDKSKNKGLVFWRRWSCNKRWTCRSLITLCLLLWEESSLHVSVQMLNEQAANRCVKVLKSITPVSCESAFICTLTHQIWCPCRN